MAGTNTSASTSAELAELAAWAETRLPGLIDAARTAAVERTPFYRDERVVPAEELRGSIERNLQFPVTAIGDPTAPLDLAALAGLPPDRAEVRTFNLSPLAALMVCEPEEGRRLADEVLGPILGLPPDDRATVLDTLKAYLDHTGSTERAADRAADRAQAPTTSGATTHPGQAGARR